MFSYSTQLLEITYMIKNDGNNDDNKTNNYNRIRMTKQNNGDDDIDIPVPNKGNLDQDKKLTNFFTNLCEW